MRKKREKRRERGGEEERKHDNRGHAAYAAYGCGGVCTEQEAKGE